MILISGAARKRFGKTVKNRLTSHFPEVLVFSVFFLDDSPTVAIMIASGSRMALTTIPVTAIGIATSLAPNKLPSTGIPIKANVGCAEFKENTDEFVKSYLKINLQTNRMTIKNPTIPMIKATINGTCDKNALLEVVKILAIKCAGSAYFVTKVLTPFADFAS